jgi:hypothetical protein
MNVEIKKNAVTKLQFLAEYKKNLLEAQEHFATTGESIEMPLLHDFQPGLYLRRILMPAGAFVIGKTHKTEHYNIVLSGSATVMIDGEVAFIQAPAMFKSQAGAKKVLLIHEEMVWLTTHATEETDLDKLEKMIVLTDEEEKEALNIDLEQINLQLKEVK